MGWWNEGTREPVDVMDRRRRPRMATGYPYVWDPEPVRRVDGETGELLVALKIRHLPSRKDGLREFAALRDKPLEQKMDAVMGLYPRWKWLDGESPLMNWMLAVADEENVGVEDVMAEVERQRSMSGLVGDGMRSWLQLLKEPEQRVERKVSTRRIG